MPIIEVETVFLSRGHGYMRQREPCWTRVKHQLRSKWVRLLVQNWYCPNLSHIFQGYIRAAEQVSCKLRTGEPNSHNGSILAKMTHEGPSTEFREKNTCFVAFRMS